MEMLGSLPVTPPGETTTAHALPHAHAGAAGAPSDAPEFDSDASGFDSDEFLRRARARCTPSPSPSPSPSPPASPPVSEADVDRDVEAGLATHAAVPLTRRRHRSRSRRHVREAASAAGAAAAAAASAAAEEEEEEEATFSWPPADAARDAVVALSSLASCTCSTECTGACPAAGERDPAAAAGRSRTSVSTASLASSGLIDAPSAGALDVLPPEALAHIWTFLDPETLARVSLVCRRFRDLGRDTHIWHTVGAREGLFRLGPGGDFDDAAVRDGAGRLSISSAVAAARAAGITRSFYVERFKHLRRERAEAERARAEAAHTALRKRRHTQCARALRVVLFNRLCEWFLLALIVVMSILVPLKLAGLLRALPWGVCLFPLLHAAAVLVGGLLLYDAAATAMRHRFEEELDGERHAAGPVFFFLLFVVPFLEASKHRVRSVHYPLTACTAALLVLVYARAVAVPTLPMSVVVSPLVLAAVVFSAAVWAAGRAAPYRGVLDRLFLQGVAAAVAAFAVLLALRADGYVAWSWQFVMLPLFAMEAATLAGPLGVLLLRAASCCCCCSCHRCRCRRRCRHRCRSCVRHASYLARAPSGPVAALGIVLAVVVVGPLATLEALLARTLDGHGSFSTAFLPLFGMECVALVGCAVLNIALWVGL